MVRPNPNQVNGTKLLAHPQFCGATFTIFKCRHSLREFPGFVGSANACFFYQRMKDFPAAFAAGLIKVILCSRAVTVENHLRRPSQPGATPCLPNNQGLVIDPCPFSPTRECPISSPPPY